MKLRPLKITKFPMVSGMPRQPKTFQDAQYSPSRDHKQVQSLKASGDVTINILELFQQFTKKTKRQESRFDVQARDRVVLLQLPDGQDGYLEDDVLQEWITDVCNKVFSSAFNTLFKDQMSYEYTKIFCSEGILRNIVLLTKKFELTERQMQIINKHIENSIVPYMKKKYPMTESTDVNKTIDQSVRPIDNRQALQNDLLQKSDVVFTYRENKNYNDLIMRFINWLITAIQQNTIQGNKKSKTVYEEYYEFISRLFQNVYDSNWMDAKTSNQKKSAENNGEGENTFTEKNIVEKKFSEAQKEKYKQQVQEYTHYAIGRKISKNVQVYTNEEINSGHLKIKSPAILRILTKWCEQLWQKFTTKNYFLEREENVRVQQKDGNINTMFMWMKMPLNDLIQEQKVRIQEFLKEVEENNFDQQSKLLLKELQKDGFTHVQKIEKACGKFACKTVNNLHSYIVLYLNRIIHGLLWVSKELYDTKLSTKARWTNPPDLITFKVGDLMRCKLHSKERQILKIFQALQNIGQKNPNEMKIIRVKNRLKMGTNDILINVIYKNKYLCELQLAVNAVQSKFIQTSNLFSHYIYELGRTLFGPVTQLCSIWMSLDPRTPEYLLIINNQLRKPQLQAIRCVDKMQHRLRTQDRPFVCSTCNIAYSHTNYIRKHKKCLNTGCNYRICARCRIQSQDESVLKIKFLSNQDKEVQQACGAIVNRKLDDQRRIPTYGVCIQIESKEIRIQRFKKLQIKRIMTIYGIRKAAKGQEKIIKIEDLIKKNAEEKFLKKYIIFEINEDVGEKLLNITIDKAKKDYIIPQKVKEIYKKQKQILSLIDENLDDQSCKIMMGEVQGMEHVLNMQLADNKFTKISFITENFPNLKRLQLSRNKISDLSTIQKLDEMQKLNLRDNLLVALPDSLCTLKKLQGINIRNNQIKEFPKNFGDLKELKKIQSDNNLFQQLPESFSNFTKVKFVDLSKNKLTKFPEQFKSFTRLEQLLLSGNLLGEIPDWIGNFKDLITLDLSKTKLKVFPNTIFNLIKLKIFKIQASQTEFISQIKNFKELKELAIKMPNLIELPDDIFKLRELQSLQIQDCRIKRLPEYLSQVSKLSSLSLINNKLQIFEEQLKTMTALKNLKLQGQNLTELPLGLKQLTNLRTLSLNSNQFKEIPLIISNFKKLYSLSLSKNELQDIPQEIVDALTHIQTINLDSNKFTAVPSVVKRWKKLKKATFEKNQIDKTELQELKNYIKFAQKVHCLLFLDLMTLNMNTTLSKMQSMLNSQKIKVPS